MLKLPIFKQCLLRDGIVTPNVNKNYVIQEAGYLGTIDVMQGEANSTGMPPNLKNKQSRVTYLSLYKY
jgi:hypothetical protein